MLGSPLATSEGDIDIITDIRQHQYKKQKRNASRIDVRHSEGFWGLCKEFKLGRELSTENRTLEQSNTFYICLSRRLTESNLILYASESQNGFQRKINVVLLLY